MFFDDPISGIQWELARLPTIPSPAALWRSQRILRPIGAPTSVAAFGGPGGDAHAARARGADAVTGQDRVRWDERYRRRCAAPAGPAGVFAPHEALFPTAGVGLDLACGRAGRQCGWRSAVWTSSGRCIAGGHRAGAGLVGQQPDPLPLRGLRPRRGLPPGPPADVIICHRFRDRRLDRAIVGRLALGGLLAVSALSGSAPGPGRSGSAPGELPEAFAGLRTIAAGKATVRPGCWRRKESHDEPTCGDFRRAVQRPAHKCQRGYACGVIAAQIPADLVEVTLRRPPPLDTRLVVEQMGDRYEVRSAGGEVVAVAQPVTEPVQPVAPVFDIPADASSALPDASHPFRTCFTCGPDRAPGDGLRIFAKCIAGQSVLADRWVPDESFGEEIPPEIVWAALDCPGGWAALDRIPGGVAVLGR